jgi:hypothetical protein
MAGWPRKNEGARLYKVAKNDYRIAFEREEDPYTDNRYVGTFLGPCFTLCREDLSKWSVKRDSNGLVRIKYEDDTQHTMGSWSTLALEEGTFNALDATDEQILRAYLGDEHIFTGEKTRPVTDGLHCVKLCTPQTWGGTAQRIQWSALPEEWKVLFRRRLNVAPANLRGLWRVGNQPKQENQTTLEV